MEFIFQIPAPLSFIFSVPDAISFVFEIPNMIIEIGGNATVQNSDESFQETVETDDVLELEDTTYNVNVNGVFNTSGSLPSMVNNEINIS